MSIDGSEKIKSLFLKLERVDKAVSVLHGVKENRYFHLFGSSEKRPQLAVASQSLAERMLAHGIAEV